MGRAGGSAGRGAASGRAFLCARFFARFWHLPMVDVRVGEVRVAEVS